MIFTKTEQRIKSALEEVATLIESINGNSSYIEMNLNDLTYSFASTKKESDMSLPYVDDNTSREELDIVKKHIQKENRLVTLNPLGHRPIKDIDEIHQRNRRKTDDPYIRLTMKNKDYKRWKNNTAERR